MNGIASKGQLRASYLRWAVVTVPLMLLLGFASGRSVPAGAENDWYVALVKPALTPPGWVFPVAWTIIYICQGLAVAMILNARGARGRAGAVGLFALGVVAALVWTPLFFGAHKVLAAAVLISAMVVIGIATALAFGRIRPLAAWLLLPYLVWISFATALTWSIHSSNPDAETVAPTAHSSQLL